MENTMIKKQRYGVEIEMTGITRAKAAETVWSIVHGNISRPECNCYHTRKITAADGRVWQVMRDSSICPSRNIGSDNIDEYKVELVTPILKYDDIETLQEIIRALRAAGAKVNSSCGIHIHVDGANHTGASLKKLVEFFTNRQDLVYESLQIGQRANQWCKKVSKDLNKAFKQDKEGNNLESLWYSRANDGYYGSIDHSHYNQTRYHGLNLHAYFSKGTVEFRLFNSTLHAGKVKAYIQFCLALSGWAISAGNEPTRYYGMEGYTAEKKVTIMKNLLTQRLGLVGEEFKTCRLWMLEPLKKAAGMSTRAA
jgi:hypothetical protein